MSNSENTRVPQTHWTRAAKCVFDRVAAAVGILAIAPLLLGIAGAILVTMGGPVFFTQLRVGKDNRLFRVFKFRTMSEPRTFVASNVTDIERAKSDAQRITPLGAFLRRTSLDELPQLFNVVAGDMSLVGPRPLLADYLERYTPRQRRRHEVRPGITGLAQVSGRNTLSWEEKFEYDVQYVESWNFLLDFVLLVRTVKVVLTGDGVEAKESVTPTPFVGLAEGREGTREARPRVRSEATVGRAA